MSVRAVSDFLSAWVTVTYLGGIGILLAGLFIFGRKTPDRSDLDTTAPLDEQAGGTLQGEGEATAAGT